MGGGTEPVTIKNLTMASSTGTGTYNITGTLTDENDDSITDAPVYITVECEGNITKSRVVTSDSGLIRLGIPIPTTPGTRYYYITVQYKGNNIYQSITQYLTSKQTKT